MRSQRHQNNAKFSTQTCPRMSKVAHGRVLVSENGAESYRGQSSWLVVRGQSIRLGRLGQSWWSVVLRGQSS